MDAGTVREVSFRNVPSFAYLREARVGVAYGGAFYAIVDAQSLGLGLGPDEVNRLVDFGRRIKRAVMSEFPIVHPFESGSIFR
jgi:proline racemase